jgi:ABC-type nitrate/sulfonate/bicarbonate transport system substrate-binding protein
MVRARACCSVVAVTLIVASCAAAGTPTVIGDTVPGATTSTSTTTTLLPPTAAVTDGGPMPPERCQANRDAGTLRFSTGDGFALTAPSFEVMLAAARGYFEELCLDVDVVSGSTSANYALVAGVDVSFAAGASLGELADYAGRNDAGFVAVAVDGARSLDALVLRDDTISELGDLAAPTGETTTPLPVTVNGNMPVSVLTMLAEAGLPTSDVEVSSVDTPVEELLADDNDETPAFVGRLDDDLLDAPDLPTWAAADQGVPGTFGVLVTTRTFLTEHPSAAEDFVRAAQRALAEARRSPDDAVTEVVDWLTAMEEPVEVDAAKERRRAQVVLADSRTPSSELDVAALRAEIDRAVESEAFGEPTAPPESLIDDTLLRAVHDTDGSLIWPRK